MKIAVATLGCKINQFDSAVLQELALDAEHQIVDYGDLADVYVINTCTVTGKADAESRALIRKARRRNPDAKVVVTGCYAQTHPEAIASVPGVDLILGNPSKFYFLERIGREGKPDESARGESLPFRWVEPFASAGPLAQPVIRRYAGHTRAFLKVQEGCDDACTFCIVPASRGPSRSLPVAAVLEQVRVFADQGYRELVLTGVQLGCYGRDLEPQSDLPSLLAAILALERPMRIRLSSIHPTDISDHFIDLLASEDRLCKHVHTSMQSGDDRILRRMARDYDRETYRDIVGRLAERVPDIGIGSDVLVGFPGETDEGFENTLRLIEALPLTTLHVFSFSPRPRTPAESFPDQVPDAVKKDRSSRLKRLATVKGESFARRFIGRSADVLMEEARDGAGRRIGHTSHYLKVAVMGPGVDPNRLVTVRITGMADGILHGEAEPPG